MPSPISVSEFAITGINITKESFITGTPFLLDSQIPNPHLYVSKITAISAITGTLYRLPLHPGYSVQTIFYPGFECHNRGNYRFSDPAPLAWTSPQGRALRA